MKTINFTILLIGFIIIKVFSQTIKVQPVKETRAVDSLIENYKLRNANNGVKNDSCFVIRISASNEPAFYTVYYPDSIYKSTVTIGIPTEVYRTKGIKYFKFKNNLVFVIGDDPFTLFSPLGNSRLFRAKLVKKNMNQLLGTLGMGYVYEYENGRFRLLGDLGH